MKEETMEERLKEIEARAAAATEGPWVVAGSPGFVRTNGPLAGEIVCSTLPDGARYGEGLRDAEFIAAARDDVPDLCAAYRTLQASSRAQAEEVRALRAVAAAARETSKLAKSLVGFAMGDLHPNDFAIRELDAALAAVPPETAGGQK